MTRDDRMHHRRDSDDRIDRTDPCAEIAADAMILVYAGDSIEARVAQAGEQGLGFSAQHIRKPTHGLISARRAAVDIGVARGDGLRIGAAAGIAALRALNSRKELLQLIGNGVRRRWEIAAAENQ